MEKLRLFLPVLFLLLSPWPLFLSADVTLTEAEYNQIMILIDDSERELEILRENQAISREYLKELREYNSQILIESKELQETSGQLERSLKERKSGEIILRIKYFIIGLLTGGAAGLVISG